MTITPILAEGIPPTVLVVFLVPLFLGVFALRSIAASKRSGRASRAGLIIRLVPVLVGGLFLFFFLTIRGGAPAGFIIVAAFPLVAGLLSLYFWGRKKPEATQAVATKGIRFKIPELNSLPPEQQEEVLRRCLESEEFARKAGKIRLACLALTVVATIAVLNIFDWAGITGDQHWSSGVKVAVVIVFSLVMIFSQMWFRVRLIRKLVRREIANA